MAFLPWSKCAWSPARCAAFLRQVAHHNGSNKSGALQRLHSYHNGQIVWVKRCEELECGDIGIFVYDDCGYLKKYDEHTPDKSQAEFLTDSYGVVHNQPVLVSLNTKYSLILISPEQRFEVVGKVLN